MKRQAYVYGVWIDEDIVRAKYGHTCGWGTWRTVPRSTPSITKK